jgi:hypothetical protein
MKRSFNTAMGSQTAQQISAGLVTTTDPVYYATNMVYTANEDITVDHGTTAAFSQTRILPIVGRTSRAEVAVESADIQTKSLPIFQPQVKLGTDVNELIYEVGVSAEWRGSMLKLPADSAPLPTLIQESGEDVTATYPSTTIRDPLSDSGTNLQTFMNDPEALGTLVDAYGLSRPVSLIPNNLYEYTYPQNLNTQTLPYTPLQGNYNYQWDLTSVGTYISPPGPTVFCWVYADIRPMYINFKFETSPTIQSSMSVVFHNSSTTRMSITFTDFNNPQQAGFFIEPGQIIQMTNAGNPGPNDPFPFWVITDLSQSIRGNPATNTILDSLFQYWNGSFQAYNPTTELFGHSAIASTCLTPVCVGSAVQKINGCGLFQSNIEYPLSMVVPVQSTDGFKVGDRVRFFGMTDIDAPNAYVPTVFGTVLDVISYNLLQNPSVDLSPALVVDYFPKYTITQASVSASSNVITLTLQANFLFDGNALYVGQRITVANVAGAGSPAVDINGTYSIGSVTVASPPVSTFTITVTYTSVIATGITWGGGSLTVSSAFTGGYVINPNSKDGGRIQFLTNEYAFRPRLMNLLSCTQGSNELVLSTNMSIGSGTNDLFNTGWFRGCGVESNTNVENFPLDNVVVQITVTPPATSLHSGIATVSNFPTLAAGVNGYYRIVSRAFTGTGQGGIVNFTLVPLNGSLTTFGVSDLIATGSYNPLTFTMQLAPNFYSFDTRADYVVDNRLQNSVNELAFLRAIGYKPTTDLILNTPTYPPTALVPDTTWDRAYTVSWSFSSYQNIKWVPQNTTSRLPNPPLFAQDFGVNSNSTTYYNVYEINKFINSCVNPSIKNLYTDYSDATSTNILELKSLNTQLALAFTGYQIALTVLTPTSTQFLWYAGTVYNYGDIVVDTLSPGGSVYMATKQLTNSPLPTGEVSYVWMYLGPVPDFASSTLYNALAVVNTPSTPANYTLSYFKVVNTVIAPSVNNRYVDQMLFCTGLAKTSLIKDTPTFKTLGPTFIYDERTLLLSWTLDNYGFATNQTPYQNQEASDVATLSYKRLSWGDKTSDEFMVFESNSSFKFLFDNFPCECISYEDTLASLRQRNPYVSGGAISSYPMISFWVWDSTTNTQLTGRSFTIFQSAESFSSCMTPVESIVIVSDNIPVAEQLTSPLYNLVDSATYTTRSTDATALTNKIIGEIFLPYLPFQSTRTVVKYEPFEMKFYTLLDTKSFKQLDYSLFYRHRITQELVPLIITNYGSVNIKFVFRPTST